MVINGTNESPRRTERRQLAQCIHLANNFFMEIMNQSPKSTETRQSTQLTMIL